MGTDDVRWFRVRQSLLIGLELVAGSLGIWLDSGVRQYGRLWRTGGPPQRIEVSTLSIISIIED